MSELAQPRTAVHSIYPERHIAREGWLDRQGAALLGPLVRRWRRYRCLRDDVVAAVNEAGAALKDMTEPQLNGEACMVRQRLRRQGLQPELVVRSFALVREAALRTIGQRHYDVQILGGWVLVNGCVAEMATGEGKTLTATLAAATAAFAGMPVHIITVNDYLAARDTADMGPLYERLGLTVASVTHELDPVARAKAYAADITYCTNKELAFDYLRDRLAMGRDPNRILLQLERLSGGERTNHLVLRGLCFGIVDEADSVLVDEARVPLIISGAGGLVPDKALYQTALALARELTRDADYAIDDRERTVRMTPSGQRRLDARARTLTGLWSGPHRREVLVCQALTALVLFQRDTHYLVRDDKVQIIDEYTGRVLGERSWEQGLHQMIEIKEGCPLTPMQAPLARITYQRFFRRYLKLSGMTGTAQEVARELWTVYRLATIRVPTNRPLRRYGTGERLFRTADDKWRAVVDRIQSLRQGGRPVLVGTRSVSASERLSALLSAAHIQHVVLNARQDSKEADIVARAGEAGRVTVATNMAGRGTDITLAPEVILQGGLHVLATERHEARRIDRQLYGRAGRQGDPGSYEVMMSLDDDLLAVSRVRVWKWLAKLIMCRGQAIEGWLAACLVRRAQASAERWHARIRRELLYAEDHLESALAFSGRLE